MTNFQLNDMEYGKFDEQTTKGKYSIRTKLVNDSGTIIDVQNPVPTDGDSVYRKDVWLDQSTSTDFTGGDVIDLFDNLHSVITNTTSNNPKTILVHFNRTIVSNVVGLGAYIGDFSNTKIEIGVSGHTFTTVIDESAVNTKYTSRTFQLPITAGINALRITFNTTDTISLSNIVMLKSTSVVARLQAAKPDNTITDINATTAGNLKVAIEEMELEAQTPFLLRVAKGEIAGHTIMSKFGQNDDIGTGAYEDIWDGGGTYPYPADGTAPITRLISDNAADTELIEVQGLDINGDLVIQTKTLTGTTAVILDTPLWRVFRLKNIGTSDIVGKICAINDADTVDYACIIGGNNQTLMALYTIPNDKTGYLLQGTNSLIGLTRAYSLSGKLMMRPYGLVFQLKKTFGLASDGSGYMVMPFPLPGKIPARTDIRVSAISSSNGGGLNTTFEILLVDN